MTDSTTGGPRPQGYTGTLAWLALAALLWLLPSPALQAQSSGVTIPAEPTLAQVRRRISDVEQLRTLGEQQREEMLQHYRQAREFLESVESELEAIRELRDAAARAPQQLEELRRQAAKTVPPPTADALEGKPLETLEAELRSARVDRDKADARFVSAREQAERLSAAQVDLRERYTLAEKELAEIVTEAGDSPGQVPPEARAEARAQAFMEAARLRTAAARTERLRTELLTLDIRLQLAAERRDASARELDRVSARAELLESVTGEGRSAAAERVREDAQATAASAQGKHPLLQQAAEDNAVIARELEQVIAAQQTLAEQRGRIEQHIRSLEDEFNVAQQRVNLAGLSSVLGKILREQRRSLPDLRTVDKQVRRREESIARVGLAQIRVDESLKELDERWEWLKQISHSSGTEWPAKKLRANLRAELVPLVEDRRKLLLGLRDAYASELKALGELEFAEQRLVIRAHEYAAFLDEHLLWIPSAEPLGPANLASMPAALVWLAGPSDLAALGRALEEGLLLRPLAPALVLIVVWMLLRSRGALRERLRDTARAVSLARTDRLSHTSVAAAVSLLLAAPPALVTAFLGWRLGETAGPDSYVAAIASGLLGISIPLFLIRVFRHVYADDGLAVAHFRWSAGLARKMRGYLRLLLLVMVPCTFLIRTLEEQAEVDYQAGLGRLAFIAMMLTLAYVMHALFHPQRGALHAYITRQPDSWLARLRHVCYLVIVGIPAALAGLAAYGYYYTALQLQEHQIETLRLVIAAIVLYHFILRALVVGRQRLLEKSEHPQDGRRVSEVSAEGTPVHLDVPSLSLDAIDHQSRRLALILIGWGVAVGLFLIWSDVLPALGLLEQVVLWDTSSLVDGAPVTQPISLRDVLLALVFGVVFMVAARNLPGVLEIAVLQHLPMDAGSRYAVTTISQYLIVGVGLIIVVQAMGMHWGQVQWLVAALGVGLGFGLQEIFANFISGIIILFERPVRIGDTVTLGELTGTVSRIRIRATTVTDWDNKEIIIPNKSFITDRLINWTLSDSIMRVTIPIGIAYGSDTHKAYEVIWQTAGENTRVLDEPRKQLLFLGFGDSSLDFELRVFVGALSEKIKVTHELHMAINDALRENGIEIPFPQRDLHIRSSVPVPVSSGSFDGGTRAPPDADAQGEGEGRV